MSKRGPLDPPSFGALDEYFRRERQRADLIRQALGPSHELEKQLKALQGPLATAAALQDSGVLAAASQLHKSGALAEAERAMKSYQDQFKGMRELMTPQWASAIKDTALAVSQNDRITKQLQSLSRSFDSGIIETAKAMQSQSAVLTAALAASTWHEQFKSLAEQMSPNLMAFGATAQRALMTELTTLRATAGIVQTTAAQIIAEQSVEAHQIAQALATADTPEEGAQLLIAFTAILAAIFDHFKENTVEELRKIGLVGILIIAFAIMALPQLQDAPEMPLEQRQAYEELHSKVDELQSTLSEILEAESELSEAFVAELPRGELTRRSNIRGTPRKDGALLLRANAGDAVAIVRTERRAWTLVVYRDPLTDQLSQGWIYGDAVRRLTAAEPDFEAQMAAAREVMARRKRALRELAK